MIKQFVSVAIVAKVTYTFHVHDCTYRESRTMKQLKNVGFFKEFASTLPASTGQTISSIS